MLKDETMTMKQIAEHFGVTKNVAEGWKWRGQLPEPKDAKAVGNQPYLYLRADILELEASGFPAYLKDNPPRNDPWPWSTRMRRDLRLAQKFYRILGGVSA